MADKKPLVNYRGSIQEIGTDDTVPISNGGTGATTAAGARNNLFPPQTGQSGKFLTTNGTDVFWATVEGSGSSTDSILFST